MRSLTYIAVALALAAAPAAAKPKKQPDPPKPEPAPAPEPAPTPPVVDESPAPAVAPSAVERGGAVDEVATSARPFKSILDSWQLQLGLAGAGPILWKDVPDARIENTQVFRYGGRLAFLFGDERRDLHRLGLAVGYDLAARSDSRKLALITPSLVYEIGHPLVLQIDLGWAIGSGSADYASHYSGLSTGAALRYSFRDASRASPVSVSLGLAGRFIVSADDLQYSSAFVGAQVELIYHNNKK